MPHLDVQLEQHLGLGMWLNMFLLCLLFITSGQHHPTSSNKLVPGTKLSHPHSHMSFIGGKQLESPIGVHIPVQTNKTT